MSYWHIPPEIITTPWEPAALAAVVSAIYLYIDLSSRLGAVTKMPPFYRWFLVGGGLTGMALAVSLLRAAALLSCREEIAFLVQPGVGLLFYHIPLLIGTVINVAVTLRYWSWLITGTEGR